MAQDQALPSHGVPAAMGALALASSSSAPGRDGVQPMRVARIDGKAACCGNVLGLCVVGSGSVADPGRLGTSVYFLDARKAEKSIAKWRGSFRKGGLSEAEVHVRERYSYGTIAG